MRYILALLAAGFIVSYPIALRAEELPKIQLEMRNYDEITLPAGTFIPVLTTQEISTETCPEGYKIYCNQ